MQDFLQTQIRTAQDKYDTSTDKSWSPAPSFKIPDLVFLASKDIRTARASRKLDWKRFGPFTVTKVISTYAYQLDLPDRQTTLCLPSLPVGTCALWPVVEQGILPPPILINDDVPDFEIEKILDSTVLYTRPRHYVKWTGYIQPKWIPAKYHSHSAAVDENHRKYLNIPRTWDKLWLTGAH